MPYETRDNTGSMFKNNRKERENQPDMTGEIMVEGKLFWLNAWRKVDKNNNPWYSFSVKPKEIRDSAPAEGKRAPIDDDIPFAPEWR